jgi:hypothetical protein
MTRDEAQALADRNAAEHADRATHVWMPRRSADGSWSVAKVAAAPRARAEDLKGAVESRPKPPQAPDPRPAPMQNMPPYGGGV